MKRRPSILMTTLLVALLTLSASAASVSFHPVTRVSSGPSDPLIVDVSAENIIIDSISMWINNTTPQSDTTILEFTSAEPLAIDVELLFDDYETVELRLSSSSGSAITNSSVEDGNSFDLVFDLESDLGASSYSFYFDTRQSGHFTDVFVESSRDELVLTFGMQFVDDLVPGAPLFTATGSGVFHAIGEPSAFALAAFGLLRRRAVGSLK